MVNVSCGRVILLTLFLCFLFVGLQFLGFINGQLLASKLPAYPQGQDTPQDSHSLQLQLADLESRLNNKLSSQIDKLTSIIQKIATPDHFPPPKPHDDNKEEIKTARFAKMLSQYEIYHNKVTSGKISSKSAKVKFVKCPAYNGFGNAFQSVVGCFLYALASNRIFLLYPNTPFPLPNYFRTPPIDYYAHHLVEDIKEYQLNAESLVCEDFSEHKKKVYILTGGWGYDYFGQNLQTNPYYNLTETLPRNFYQLIHSYLFVLNDQLQAKVDDFKKENFGQYTIAIQIRATIKKTEDTGSWYKGKKDHEGHPVPPLSLFAQAAEVVSNQNRDYAYQDIKWFVVTQDMDFLKKLEQQYGKKIVFFRGKIVTTFDDNEEGQETSFLTWWLMGECQDHITSEASSYGTTAAARAGVAPVVCNHGRFCARKLTPQPCQQTPYFGKGEADYQIMPPDCLVDKSRNWFSVESSCAFFEAIIRDDPRYERGDSW